MGEPAQQPIHVSPFGPVAGASREDTIRGFLSAGYGFDDDHAIARSFLTQAASDEWKPDTGVTVHDNADASVKVTLSGRTVQVSTSPVAVLDGNGYYHEVAKRHAGPRVVRARPGGWPVADLLGPQGVRAVAEPVRPGPDLPAVQHQLRRPGPAHARRRPALVPGHGRSGDDAGPRPARPGAGLPPGRGDDRGAAGHRADGGRRAGAVGPGDRRPHRASPLGGCRSAPGDLGAVPRHAAAGAAAARAGDLAAGGRRPARPAGAGGVLVLAGRPRVPPGRHDRADGGRAPHRQHADARRPRPDRQRGSAAQGPRRQLVLVAQDPAGVDGAGAVPRRQGAGGGRWRPAGPVPVEGHGEPPAAGLREPS